MSILNKLILSIIFLFTLASCLVKEEITPLAEPISLSELQREKILNQLENQGHGPLDDSTKTSIEYGDDDDVYYLKIKYNVSEVDVFQAADIPNQFEALAHSFLGLLTRAVLSSNGPQNVDLDDITLDLPDLEIDRSIIKSIRVHKIFIKYSDKVERESDYLSDFSFVDSLDLTMAKFLPGIGTVNDILFSYRKTSNNCLYKCLIFDIHNNEVLKLIEGKKKLTLKPFLTLSSLPAVSDLKIEGQVILQIGLKLPL